MEVLLHGASRLGDTPLVRELLSALLATGAEPSAATYRAVLHAQGEDATLAGRWACVVARGDLGCRCWGQTPAATYPDPAAAAAAAAAGTG
jgi:hypothetical protein